MRHAWCALGLLIAAAGAGRASVGAVVEPSAPQLGERALLRLQAAPADSTELPRALDVALRATADPKVFEVIATRVGLARIVLPATGDTLSWDVQPRLAEVTPDSLRPWARVGDLGPNWWPTALVLLALLTPLGWWMSRLRRRSEPFEIQLVEPPHVIALRRLDELAARGWIAAGRFDEFYVEASHTLRAYVGGRFGVPALDWTTDETFDRLLAAGHERQTLAPIDPLLRSADIVKFAGQLPTEHQAESWLARAREWIESTAVEPVYSTPEALEAAARLRGGAARASGDAA